MADKPPTDPADRARDFAKRWEDKLEKHCVLRMVELSVPDIMIGRPD
jgi:hypothetical protein